MKTSLLLVPWVVVGCGKHDGSSTAGAGAKLEYTALADLGIEAEIPVGSIDDHRKNRPGTITIETSPKLVIAAERSPEWLDDLAAVKQAIATNVTSFHKLTKEEASGEGAFHLEYELESGDGAPSYGFTLRRRVGGKLYDCGTRLFEHDTVTKAQLASSIKICQSLRAPGGTAAAATPPRGS